CGNLASNALAAVNASPSGRGELRLELLGLALVIAVGVDELVDELIELLLRAGGLVLLEERDHPLRALGDVAQELSIELSAGQAAQPVELLLVLGLPRLLARRRRGGRAGARARGTFTVGRA